MCRIPPSPTSARPEARRRPLAHRAPSGRRGEAANLLREMAYVYHLTERVRNEMAADVVPLRTKPVRVL